MGNVRDEIAKNLLYYRKKKKLTQKELSEYLGVNNSAVSNWEKGLNSIDIDTLHRACIALNVSVNDMFGTFSNVSGMVLTPDEVEIVVKFRKLDDRGKAAVTRALEQEYAYIETPKFTVPNIEQIKKEAQNMTMTIKKPAHQKK
ncbi:MAG: helix-turn-helix transcriptional regulator, partial [Christensenellaceae bacterium]